MTVYLDSIFSRLATERLPWDALVWTETQQSVSEELERFKTFKNKLSWDLKFVFVLPVVSKKMAKDWGAIWNQEILSGFIIFSPTHLRYLAPDHGRYLGLVWLATMTRDQVELGSDYLTQLPTSLMGGLNIWRSY